MIFWGAVPRLHLAYARPTVKRNSSSCLLVPKRDVLAKYYDFAIQLGKRMQSLGEVLASKNPDNLHHPAFYKCDVGFVSLNYDTILLWVQFNANRYLNHENDVPKVNGTPLKLFHDFGHMIPARGIEGKEPDWPWIQ